MGERLLFVPDVPVLVAGIDRQSDPLAALPAAVAEAPGGLVATSDQHSDAHHLCRNCIVCITAYRRWTHRLPGPYPSARRRNVGGGGLNSGASSGFNSNLKRLIASEIARRLI